MAYNEKLANRIREKMQHLKKVQEKEMMGGLAFLYNGKMCVGIVKDELMCRIGPDAYEEALEQKGCRPMDFTGKPMKGWVFVAEDGFRSKENFDYWIDLAVAFNKEAKPYKRKKKIADE